MPRVEEDPPEKLRFERDGLEFTVGRTGCDFTWLDISALLIWRRRFNMHNPNRKIGVLPYDHFNAMLSVQRTWPSSHYETPDEVMFGERKKERSEEFERYLERNKHRRRR